MRAMILAATLACAALSGCDQTPTAAVAPTAPAAPAPVAAPASAPAQSAAQTAYPTHRRHHHAWAREENLQSEYSESDVSTYGYVSDSHSSGGALREAVDAAARPGGGLWVDGYGRGHFTSVRVVRAGTMRGKRLAPWKGYDERCDR